MAALPGIAIRVHGGMTPSACVAQAVAAERAGFSTLWFAENPFQRGVWPAMIACAIATRRLRIGIGVFNPYNRHPTLIAMEMGAFDELTDGRAALGLGSGIASKVTQMRVPYDRPIAAVRDAIEISRRLLQGEEVRYAGKVFSAEGVRLEFPLRRTDMPILMAAMGDQALRLCGELADGVLISNMCPPAYTRRAVALLRRAAASAGKPAPREVIQYVPCAVREDGAEARAVAKGVVGAMLSAYWRLGASAPAIRAAISEDSGVEAREFARMMERLMQGEAATRVFDDAFLANYAVAGTLDECLEQCRSYGEAGVTELAVWFVGDRTLEEIDRFARGVAQVR